MMTKLELAVESILGGRGQASRFHIYLLCLNFANLRWQLYYASFNCADHLKLCVNSKFNRGWAGLGWAGLGWAGRCCWNSEIRFKLVNNSP